jgi:hypothetical protein
MIMFGSAQKTGKPFDDIKKAFVSLARMQESKA